MLCASFTTPLAAQIEPDEWVSVDIASEGYMATWDLPSLTAAVGEGSNTIYQKGYGNFNKRFYEPIAVPQQNTKYRVGSISKALTVTVLFAVIQQMINAGHIIDAGSNGIFDDIDAAVLEREVFPPAPNAILSAPFWDFWDYRHDRWDFYNPIEVRHLINNASGLGLGPWFLDWPAGHYFDSDESNVLNVHFSIATEFVKSLPISTEDVVKYALMFSLPCHEHYACEHGVPDASNKAYNYGNSSFGYPALTLVIEELYHGVHGIRKSFEDIAVEIFSSIGAFHTLPGKTKIEERHEVSPGVYDEAFYHARDGSAGALFPSRVDPWIYNNAIPEPSDHYQYGGAESLETSLAAGGFISTPFDLITILSALYDSTTLMDADVRDHMLFAASLDVPANDPGDPPSTRIGIATPAFRKMDSQI